MMPSYIYAPAKNRRSGSTMQKYKARGTLSRYEAARIVVPGFPWEGQFKTAEEIEQHCSGDRIPCLICGRTFKTVLGHVKLIHKMDADDYRIRFNIPLKFTLEVSSTTARRAVYGHSAKNKETLAKMRDMIDRTKPHRPSALARIPMNKQAHANNLQNVPPPVRGLGGRFGNSLLYSPVPLFTDFSWHLEQIRTIYGFSKIMPPAGLASWSTFNKRKETDPELREAARIAAAERPRCIRKNWYRSVKMAGELYPLLSGATVPLTRRPNKKKGGA